MTLIGRNYYDMSQPQDLRKYNMDIVHGYTTSIATYENKLLLCAEVSHRLIHQQTIYDVMDQLYTKDRYTFKEQSIQVVIGQIVMTR